jgi:trans-2-enoyl-CoA reductase
MRRIELHRHTRPDLACKLVDVPELDDPGPDQVIVAIRASAINPADLLMFEGLYPGPEILPAPVGIEGAGIVVKVGAGVTTFAPGDHIISLGRANWAEEILVDAGTLVRIPKELSFRDAAQLKANPPSAYLMLTEYENLQAGDWVIQNAANSAVGRHVIRYSKSLGIKTINIVRRKAQIAELKALGADVVVVDCEDLVATVRAECGSDANVRLGLDAICGDATEKLADCVSDGGTVAVYGFLSGKPCRITPYQLIVHNLVLKGFWLVNFMRSNPPEVIEAMYTDVSRAFLDGTLVAPVEQEYTFDHIDAALSHANREARSGKILLTPNGPID